MSEFFNPVPETETTAEVNKNLLYFVDEVAEAVGNTGVDIGILPLEQRLHIENAVTDAGIDIDRVPTNIIDEEISARLIADRVNKPGVIARARQIEQSLIGFLEKSGISEEQYRNNPFGSVRQIISEKLYTRLFNMRTEAMATVGLPVLIAPMEMKMIMSSSETSAIVSLVATATLMVFAQTQMEQYKPSEPPEKGKKKRRSAGFSEHLSPDRAKAVIPRRAVGKAKRVFARKPKSTAQRPSMFEGRSPGDYIKAAAGIVLIGGMGFLVVKNVVQSQNINTPEWVPDFLEEAIEGGGKPEEIINITQVVDNAMSAKVMPAQKVDHPWDLNVQHYTMVDPDWWIGTPSETNAETLSGYFNTALTEEDLRKMKADNQEIISFFDRMVILHEIDPSRGVTPEIRDFYVYRITNGEEGFKEWAQEHYGTDMQEYFRKKKNITSEGSGNLPSGFPSQKEFLTSGGQVEKNGIIYYPDGTFKVTANASEAIRKKFGLKL